MQTRRRFMKEAVGAAALLTLPRAAGAAEKEDKDKDEDVPPTEDLMREHGVLRRILLAYREVIRRFGANQPVPPEVVAHAAQIVRAFIEDYHERDEEQYIFPRLVKAGKLQDLVSVLLAQHQAGRKLTATIQRLANAKAIASASSRHEMAAAMDAFIRMYEPHAAREDTILFPTFVEVVGEKERRELMEIFEKKEQSLPLGNFEKMVADVAGIEQKLGIYDLAQFTPKV